MSIRRRAGDAFSGQTVLVCGEILFAQMLQMTLSENRMTSGVDVSRRDVPLSIVEDQNGLVWQFFTGTDRELIDLIRTHNPERPSTTVAVCNVHMFIEARTDKVLSSAISGMSFSLCDGQPIAWLVGLIEGRSISRVTGPDIFEEILLNHLGDVKVALVGGTPEILANIKSRLDVNHSENILLIDPGMVVTGMPPDPEIISRLKEFGPGIIFVGLGCPKQEKWMHEASKLVTGVFIGVGAAFQYFTGDIKRAPMLARALGLEWAYRLVQQPHLLGRYWRTNVPFLCLFFSVLLRRLVGMRKIGP